METNSLKALALKVIQRNQKGNSLETKEKKHGNLEGEKFPLRTAYKIYSEILHAYLLVADTDEDIHSLRFQGVSEAIYTADEIRKLKGMDAEGLRAIHQIKKIFKDSTVEQVRLQRACME